MEKQAVRPGLCHLCSRWQVPGPQVQSAPEPAHGPRAHGECGGGGSSQTSGLGRPRARWPGAGSRGQRPRAPAPFPSSVCLPDGWIGPRALLVRTAGAAQTWGKPTGARPTSALQPGATTEPGGLGRGHLGATGTNPLSHNDRRRSWCQPWAGPGCRA